MRVRSKLLPTALIDYVAARALPRATTWLRPFMESSSPQAMIDGGGKVR